MPVCFSTVKTVFTVTTGDGLYSPVTSICTKRLTVPKPTIYIGSLSLNFCSFRVTIRPSSQLRVKKNTLLQKFNEIEYGSSTAIYGNLYNTKEVVKKNGDVYANLYEPLFFEALALLIWRRRALTNNSL